jgi:hypothetical protein
MLFELSQSTDEFRIQITEQRFLGIDVKKKACRSGKGLNIPVVAIAPIGRQRRQKLAFTSRPPKERLYS